MKNEQTNNKQQVITYMECANCGTKVEDNERCSKCNCGISKPHVENI